MTHVRQHAFQAATFPSSAPNAITPTHEACRFDPDIHLQLDAPEYVKMPTVDGDSTASDRVRFPVPFSETSHVAHDLSTGAPVPFAGLAYTAPFRVLSDEGVRAFRLVISDNEKYATCVPSLVPKCLRGLGYRSDFVRDLNYSPQLLAHLSKCCGCQLAPHDMSMNLSQVNFGEVGGGPVNQWHIDSVPYVMVILLSDATDMVGGELLVARLGDPTKAIELIRTSAIDPKLIDTVHYPAAGFAIFMQGSEIAHAVTPVVSAVERRITCVNSYQSLNPFVADKTVYKTFTTMDGDAPPFEFARHVAWRVQGQLDYLLTKVANGKDGHGDVKAILERAGAELQRAHGLITNRIEDERPYDVDGRAAAEADAAIDAYGTRAPIVDAESETLHDDAPADDDRAPSTRKRERE